MKDVEIIKARNVLSSRARTNLAKRLRVAAYCRVSTDSEDQLNSYKSQVQHYTDLIKSKSEWDLAKGLPITIFPLYENAECGRHRPNRSDEIQ